MSKIVTLLIIVVQILYGSIFNFLSIANSTNNEENIELLHYYIDAKITEIPFDDKIENRNDFLSILHTNDILNIKEDGLSISFSNNGEKITFFVTDDYVSHLNHFTGYYSSDYLVLVYFTSNVGVAAFDKESCIYLLNLIGVPKIQYINRKSECEIIEYDIDISLCKLAKYCRLNGMDMVTYSGGESYTNDYSIYIESGVGGTKFVSESIKVQLLADDTNVYKSRKVILFNNGTIVTDLDIWDNIGEEIKYY